MNNSNKKYISDIITESVIESWQLNTNIMIATPTGSGKSYFSLYRLSGYARKKGRKILYLLPRRSLKRQFTKEIEKSGINDVVTIMSYQQLEDMIKKNKSFLQSIEQYFYVVIDECHYFTSDSTINEYTDISLQKILECNCVRIFMSATPNEIEEYLIVKKHVKFETYRIEPSKNKISSIYFYKDKDNEDEALCQMVDICISNRTKCIVFVQKLQTGLKLYKKYKEYCLFYCSQQKKEYKYVDEKAIDEMAANEKFDKLVLITTTALDVGFNIKDVELNNIIIDGISDTNTIIQCIGRKRMVTDGDTVSVYIKDCKNSSINGRLSVLKGQIKMANFLENHTDIEMVQQFPKKSDDLKIIYDYIKPDGTIGKAVNGLKLFHFQKMIEEYEEIVKIKPYGLRKTIMDKFNIKSCEMWDNSSNRDLEEYLKSLYERKEVMLTNKERQPFLERLNIKRNSKLIKGADTLNYIFENEYKINYRIKQFETTRRNGKNQKPDKYKAAWKIVKV